MEGNKVKKIIIDTDPGIDDSQAILLALSCKSLEILAITISHGNSTDMEIMARNALYLLHLVNRTDIPIFIGPNKPICRPTHKGAKFAHGENLMGNVNMENFNLKKELIQTKSAPQAIIDIVKRIKEI